MNNIHKINFNNQYIIYNIFIVINNSYFKLSYNLIFDNNMVFTAFILSNNLLNKYLFNLNKNISIKIFIEKNKIYKYIIE